MHHISARQPRQPLLVITGVIAFQLWLHITVAPQIMTEPQLLEYPLHPWLPQHPPSATPQESSLALP